jgi:hypothetical protein
MELIIILSCCFLSFMAGNVTGYSAGMKKAEELYKKYL